MYLFQRGYEKININGSSLLQLDAIVYSSPRYDSFLLILEKSSKCPMKDMYNLDEGINLYVNYTAPETI